jgi:hypothetical protein
VSGEVARPSSPAVVPPAVEPAVPAKPVPVDKPTTGTIIWSVSPRAPASSLMEPTGGDTPLSMTLPGKEVYIKLSLPGYLDYAATLTVEAGTIVHLVWPLPLGSAAH